MHLFPQIIGHILTAKVSNCFHESIAFTLSKEFRGLNRVCKKQQLLFLEIAAYKPVFNRASLIFYDVITESAQAFYIPVQRFSFNRNP